MCWQSTRGTEAIKAGLFDLQGNRVAIGSRTYATTFPRSGWAEQDPQAWWDGLVGAVRDCLVAAGVPVQEIVGISADATTCTLVPMSRDGHALRRALLWMDVRAADQARRVYATGDPSLRYCLAGVNAEWMPPKMLWLKEHEPELYARTDYLLEFADLDRLPADGADDTQHQHGGTALVLSYAERRVAAGLFCVDRAG